MEKVLKDGRILNMREVSTLDALTVLNFFKIVNLESKNLMREPHEFNLTLEDEITFIKKNLASNNDFMAVGFVDDVCVSTAGFHGNSLERVKHRVSMGISVLKDFQDLGVGGFMMEYVLQQARAYGKLKMELEVRSDNLNAIRLYRRHGFREEGLISNGFYVDRKFVDLILMSVYL